MDNTRLCANNDLKLSDLYNKVNGNDYNKKEFTDLDCLLNPLKYNGKKKLCDPALFEEERDITAVLKVLSESTDLVYALIAPAFLGQIFTQMSPGILRSAFKFLGFDGMLEVALFADILTLREALEFDRNVRAESDFQITSCCCPMWIAMIRKVYSQITSHLSGSVSPMIACGRVVKKLHPTAKTIFIGPCVAKKAEIKEKDLQGAIDYVLTFQEMQKIFNATRINFDKLSKNKKDHSSHAGRIYARAGGVSEAVRDTVNRINPDREFTIKTKMADGIVDCKKMMNELLNGEITANFFEGMGCIGGCVGGPKVTIDKVLCRENVNVYATKSNYITPIDNPYVIELLHRIGIDTVNDLLNRSDIFNRKI